jgi:hypothetical protein
VGPRRLPEGARDGVFEVENALFPLDALPRAVNACVILFRYVGRIVFPLHLTADESAWSDRESCR